MRAIKREEKEKIGAALGAAHIAGASPTTAWVDHVFYGPRSSEPVKNEPSGAAGESSVDNPRPGA